jgi:N-acetyl sugar amidotransferase
MIRICNRCVMDSGVPNIHFNDAGVCNYCEDFVKIMQELNHHGGSEREKELNSFVETVKHDGIGKTYDCIVGVSGGVDSAWVLYQTKKLGLRPLAVHMDNGWNSELAQSNIENLVRYLNVDLYTHVIDWQEYRKLMQSFFDADVIDVELLYDNAMFGVNYQLAARHNIKWILAGTNKSTEGMRMPNGWNWFKFDKKNILSIGLRGKVGKIKTYPLFGVLNYIYYEYIRNIKWKSFLDLFDYKKEDALLVLEKECSYKRYPYKHYESIFTRFYQGYILPNKFSVDKRKLHLSTLVITGQLTRESAISSLSKIPYLSLEDLEKDKEYFLKKMGWTKEQLNEYIARPGVPHDSYGSEIKLWKRLGYIYKLVGGKSRL